MGKARDYIPALRFGNKIMPEDIAGMIGLPSVGNVFYVDAGSGNDSTNSGTSRDDAFKTLTAAYAALTADQDDVVVICASSSTGRTSEAAAITWAKRRTHVVGNGPLRTGWNRQGVSFASTVSTPSLTVSATNCSFTNVIFVNFEDINVLVNVTGDYNTFNYVHFAGIANTTTGADNNGRCVVITDADDVHFNHCMFGIDTVVNSATNTYVELSGASNVARTQFNDCIWSMTGDDAAISWVKFNGGNSSQVYTLFRDCMFLNSRDTTTTLNDGMIVPGAVNGKVIMDNCWFYGATNLTDAEENVYVNAHAVDAQSAGTLIVDANA